MKIARKKINSYLFLLPLLQIHVYYFRLRISVYCYKPLVPQKKNSAIKYGVANITGQKTSLINYNVTLLRSPFCNIKIYNLDGGGGEGIKKSSSMIFSIIFRNVASESECKNVKRGRYSSSLVKFNFLCNSAEAKLKIYFWIYNSCISGRTSFEDES